MDIHLHRKRIAAPNTFAAAWRRVGAIHPIHFPRQLGSRGFRVVAASPRLFESAFYAVGAVAEHRPNHHTLVSEIMKPVEITAQPVLYSPGIMISQGHIPKSLRIA